MRHEDHVMRYLALALLLPLLAACGVEGAATAATAAKTKAAEASAAKHTLAQVRGRLDAASAREQAARDRTEAASGG